MRCRAHAHCPGGRVQPAGAPACDRALCGQQMAPQPALWLSSAIPASCWSFHHGPLVPNWAPRNHSEAQSWRPSRRWWPEAVPAATLSPAGLARRAVPGRTLPRCLHPLRLPVPPVPAPVAVPMPGPPAGQPGPGLAPPTLLLPWGGCHSAQGSLSWVLAGPPLTSVLGSPAWASPRGDTTGKPRGGPACPWGTSTDPITVGSHQEPGKEPSRGGASGAGTPACPAGPQGQVPGAHPARSVSGPSRGGWWRGRLPLQEEAAATGLSEPPPQTHYEQFDGFVVIHGTDTMAFAASVLAFVLEHLQKTVVLTGAQVTLGARARGQAFLRPQGRLPGQASRSGSGPRPGRLCQGRSCPGQQGVWCPRNQGLGWAVVRSLWVAGRQAGTSQCGDQRGQRGEGPGWASSISRGGSRGAGPADPTPPA